MINILAVFITLYVVFCFYFIMLLDYLVFCPNCNKLNICYSFYLYDNIMPNTSWYVSYINNCKCGCKFVVSKNKINIISYYYNKDNKFIKNNLNYGVFLYTTDYLFVIKDLAESVVKNYVIQDHSIDSDNYLGFSLENILNSKLFRFNNDIEFDLKIDLNKEIVDFNNMNSIIIKYEKYRNIT